MCVACVCLIENKMLKRIKFQIKLINSKFSKYNKKNVKLKKNIYIYKINIYYDFDNCIVPFGKGV